MIICHMLDFGFGSRRPAGGAKISDDGFVARVRLPQVTPLKLAFGLAFALPILAMIAVGFSIGSNPPLQTMLVVWSVVLSLVILASIYQWLRVLSGRYDLVIDRTANRSRYHDPRDASRWTTLSALTWRQLCSVEPKGA